MATAWRKVKSENDLGFTNSRYAESLLWKIKLLGNHDKLVCPMGSIFKSFCADENSCNYSNKLKVASFFGKKLKFKEMKKNIQRIF